MIGIAHGVSVVMRVHVDEQTDGAAIWFPRCMHWDGRQVGIVDILDHWHGADHGYVKVKGHDGGLYVLRFDMLSNEWELTMFVSERGELLAAE